MAIHLETHRLTLFLAFVLLFLTCAGVIAFVYLPRATITVFPATAERQKQQEIILSAQAKEPDFRRFILPGKALMKTVEVSKDVVRTNTTLHDDFAKGQVALFNKQNEAQSLLPKTHLRHEGSGVFFLTDSAVKIPPQASVAVGITAKAPGASGNVAAGTFLVDKLPASLRSLVFATSDLPMTGGTIVDTPLTQAEIDAAMKDLLVEGRRQAQTQLSLAAAGAPVRPDLLATQVESQSSSAPAGSLASSFTVHSKVNASAFLTDENDLLGLTLLALRSNLAQDEEFISYDPKSFEASLLASNFERGEAKIRGTLTGTYAQKISPNVIQTSSLAGLAPGEVEEKLKQLPGIGKVKVKLWPFWVRTVPARVGAVTTVVENKK
ncbi:MAG: baseplate J/gp47 family protein [Candidatus Sungbacteria bacterium]|nr:baseplate J/gp47 family protein [Candidatus Sungbacteria bacterium]